jgi:hypothetical protein
LRWNASENAVSYTLTISENEDFSGEKLEFNAITGTEYTLSDSLKFETKYYWKVTAISGGKTEGNSKECDKAFAFTTRAMEECGSFSLTSPSDNATQVAIKPTLRWNASENALSYTLTISENEDFSGEKAEITDIAETEYTFTSNLKYETTYYWKVTAIGEGDDNTTDCAEVFSFTTMGLIVENFDNLDGEGFSAIYTAVQAERGQITAELHETPWEGMDNGKSIKLAGTGLLDWSYLQVKGMFSQIDMSDYDGIQFMIYPKSCDQRLGMILHLINGDYPNDAMAKFAISGNAPSFVRIPFSVFEMRAESQQEEFNSSYVTGIWFTFKNASSLGVGEGFGGTFPAFEIYFDEFKGYKDDSLTSIDYEPSYKDEFEILSVDASSAGSGDLTFVWTKSGAGDTYRIKIASDESFSTVIFDNTVTGTQSIRDGIAIYTGTINAEDVQMGATYYAKMSCGETETETVQFETADMLLIDFNNLADTDALVAA